MRHEVFLIYGRSVTLSCLRPTQPAISRKPRNSGGVRCSSKWTVTQAHPLGEAIKKAGYDGRGFSKSMRPPMVHIVSEQLCGKCGLARPCFRAISSSDGVQMMRCNVSRRIFSEKLLSTSLICGPVQDSGPPRSTTFCSRAAMSSSRPTWPRTSRC